MNEYPIEVNALIQMIVEEANKPFSKVGANLFCQHLLNVWDDLRPGTPKTKYINGELVTL